MFQLLPVLFALACPIAMASMMALPALTRRWTHRGTGQPDGAA